MSFYGKKHTEEHKKKISKAMKNYWANASIIERKKMLEKWLLTGQKANRGRKLSEEHKNKISEWSKKRRHSEESKEKIANSLRGIKHSEERKNKNSKSLLLFWSKKSFKDKQEKMKKPTIASQEANPSSIEIAIRKVLDLLNVKYETQVSFCYGKFVVDIYVPNRDLIIECNGDYWHSLPNRIKRDKSLQRYCDKWGIKLAWIWESEIRKNPRLALKNALIGVL